MNVPRQINGMAVIEYATLSDSASTNGNFPTEDGKSPHQVQHVAICRAPEQQGFYTTFCTADWEHVASEFNETLLSARLAPHRKFEDDVEWQLPGYSAAKFFSVAQRCIIYAIVAAIFLTVVRRLPGVARLLENSPMLNIIWSIIATTIVASTLAIWLLVAYIASKSGGWLYGLMHFALVILLTPVCFVGLFVIPSLVMGDLSRWHDWTESQHNRVTTNTAL